MKIKTRVCCILCTFLVGMPFTACMHDNKGSSGTDGISLSSVQQKVKDALGDDYVPDQSLDDAALEQLYGIKAEDLEEYSAEISSMSAHVDQFAAFKAKPDRADAVEQALRDYRERLVEDTMRSTLSIPVSDSDNRQTPGLPVLCYLYLQQWAADFSAAHCFMLPVLETLRSTWYNNAPQTGAALSLM